MWTYWSVLTNVVRIILLSYHFRYMYTERIDIRSENVGALLYASKRFHLKGLLDACIEFLDSKISVEDVCKILEQAHTYNETKLFEKCLKFILLNAADVLKTRAFSEVCPDCLKKIISSNDLKADEEVIFEATMEWATNECRRKRMTATDENRRQVLGNLLYLIRFPTMDVTYFTHRVSMRDILSDDEAVSVFQYFHGEERELSRKFNRNERNRIKSKKSYMVDSNSNPGLGNFEPMTTAQFVESRRTMRISPTVRFASPVKQKTPLVLSIPKGPNISRVARFASYDGKWKQNGPPDAISFTCSSHIVLYGVEMYGACSGAETYKVKIYLYDDMKEEVCRNEVVVNTDSYRTTCDVMFPRKVRVPPRRVFTVVVAIKGSPCHKGIDGRAFRERDGVTFEFINSNRSSNGTDVNVGQIPALIFDRTE